MTLFAVIALPFFFSLTNAQTKELPQIAQTEQPVQTPPEDDVVLIDPGNATAWFGTIWAAGSFLMLLRLAVSYRSLRRLKNQASPLPFDAELSSRALSLLTSPHVPSPIAVGFRNPAIIVPQGFASKLSASELNGVLIHEYAHIARRDDWMNLLGRFLEALLWFHPPARFILDRISLARELACDEWVVYRTGNARAYAATLLKLTELQFSGGNRPLATGILGRKPHLSYRIEQMLLLGFTIIPSVSIARLAALTAVVASLVFLAGSVPALVAFQSKEPPAFAAREGYLAGLKAAGYTHLEVDEIIELKNNGIQPKYIAQITKVLGNLTPKQLIELHNNGVQAKDAVRAKDLNSKLTVQQIVKFKNAGILN